MSKKWSKLISYIDCIKRCLTSGYSNYSDLVLPLPHKMSVLATTIIKVKAYVSHNCHTLIQCNEKLKIYSYNKFFNFSNLKYTIIKTKPSKSWARQYVFVSHSSMFANIVGSEPLWSYIFKWIEAKKSI